MAWDISTLTYDNKSYDVSSETLTYSRVFFSPDGTKMYAGYGEIFQYTLSTPWDISTASYSGKSYDTSEQGTGLFGIFIDSSGTKLFKTDDGYDYAWQYTLSTPWDISTASYDDKAYDTYPGYMENHPRGLFFTSDGIKMYVGGGDTRRIFQHTLSTPWDISTASYSGNYYDFREQTGSVLWSFFFNPDGTKLFVLGSNLIYQYTLSTPWDITTAVYDNKFKSVITEDNLVMDLFLRANSTKLYVIGSQHNTVYQYSFAVVDAAVTTLPATSIWDNYCLANGDITGKGGLDVTERGFEYGYEEEALWCIRETGISLNVDVFTMKIDGLTPETTYHYRSFFTTSAGETYGGWVEFTTTVLHQPTYDIYTEPFTGTYRLYVSDDEAIAWRGYKGPYSGKQQNINITDITNKTKGVKVLKIDLPEVNTKGNFHVCISVKEELKS